MHTITPATPRAQRLAGAAAAALLAAVTLTGCSFTLGAAGAEPGATTEPAPATTTDTGPGTTTDPDDPTGGTRPAEGDAGFVESEAGGIALFQDRWYDNFCSSVLISMGDENCVGIAIEGLDMIDGAADRVRASDNAGDADLLAAATAAEDAADAFRAAECDVYTSDTCVGPTDDFTDAIRAYGDVLTEILAAQ